MLETKRWSILPIKHMDLWTRYKNAQKQNWVAEEIDLSKDHFHELSEKEQVYLKNLLAFFAVSDGIVIENLAVNFLQEVDIPEAQFFYGFQIAIESVHSEAYGLLVDTYIKDPIEKDMMFNAVEKIPAVANKAEWAIKWIKSPSFVERLIAFACVEGIAFSSTFAGIFWYRSRNKMPGLCNANELILRDENSHYEFANYFYNNYVEDSNKIEVSVIKSIILGCYEAEKVFVENTMPSGLDGLSKDDMIQYVKYVTDTVLMDFGCGIHFGVSNPLDYMNRISLQRRGNFFESRGNNDYTRVDIPTGGIVFDDDF